MAERSYNQAYYAANRERLLAANAAWREANKERHRANAKRWQQENPSRYQRNQRRWKAGNPAYSRDYYHSTEQRRATIALRACLRSAMLGCVGGERRERAWRKDSRIAQLLACSKAQLVAHIEAQFLPGMAWANYGSGWEIDHIRQCSTFDLTDPVQQAICFHYTNLRPLWRADNLSRPKGSA